MEYFRIMAFAQLTYRESLRDIVSCLGAAKNKKYAMGIPSFSLNNLSQAGQNRNWKIFAEFAQILIPIAKQLYIDEDLGIDLDATVYALDSTTIDLCLSLFGWADFRTTKAAIKMHTLLDLRGGIPDFIRISSGKIHDVRILDEMNFLPGAWYIMDWGYLDFRRLHRIHEESAFFVTLAKRNTQIRRLYSNSVDKTTGVKCDQVVIAKGFYSKQKYKDKLRRIKFYDEERSKRLVFLTNNMNLPSLDIAKLYKKRWQVELFFKWIKQNLRIKTFYGHSENAVYLQIWIAISVYLLVAILRKELKIDRSMSEILQIFSAFQFTNIPIKKLFDNESELSNTPEDDSRPFLPGFFLGH